MKVASNELRRLRDIASWTALGGAFVIAAGQWIVDIIYVDREVWVDRTPRGLILVGFLLTLLTFLFALMALPRWQSFVALLAVLWVTFISLQGV
jgi:hypothetical protein